MHSSTSLLRRSLAALLVVGGLTACGGATPVEARPTYTRFLTGTGFFVSRNGHVVTNEHVVQNCQGIALRNQSGMKEADLVAVDTQNDLALLRTTMRPSQVARLRWMPERLQPGDRVQLIGYPEEYGLKGEPHITESTIQSLYGPLEETHWLQFTDSARQGNSGGPLLDQSGNVVGVVTAKATFYHKNPYAPLTTESETKDVAVTVPVLKQFLDEKRVPYTEEDSMVYASDRRIQTVAERYTVQVLCRQ